MNVEELLSRSAHEVAAAATPPPMPDPMDLGARAVSLRLRRRLGAAAAATVATVAVAAVLVPTVAGRQSGGEQADRPTYEPFGNVPAWVDVDGDVHVGEHLLDLPEGELAPAGGGARRTPIRFSVTRSGVVWRGGENPTMQNDDGTPLSWQAPGGEPVELAPGGALFFTADPLGDHVVWVTPQGGTMITYDAGAARVVDRRSVPGILSGAVPHIGTSSPILYVGDDRVVYEMGLAVWSLDLATGTSTELEGVLATDLLDFHPDVSVVAVSHLRDQGGASALAQLEFRTATGTVRAKHGRLFREGRLSPDGRWFVTSTGYEAGLRTVVLDTGTGEQVPLDLPDQMREAYPNPWGWSGSDVLMVGLLQPQANGKGGVEDLWTCRPATGTCERLPAAAQTFPW